MGGVFYSFDPKIDFYQLVMLFLFFLFMFYIHLFIFDILYLWSVLHIPDFDA